MLLPKFLGKYHEQDTDLLIFRCLVFHFFTFHIIIETTVHIGGIKLRGSVGRDETIWQIQCEIRRFKQIRLFFIEVSSRVCRLKCQISPCINFSGSCRSSNRRFRQINNSYLWYVAVLTPAFFCPLEFYKHELNGLVSNQKLWHFVKFVLPRKKKKKKYNVNRK